MNVAIVGSNFGLRGYLPAINKINNLNIKIICSRKINKVPIKNLKKFKHETNWKNVFKKEIDLIILAVPPKIQEKIILFNLKHRKKLIFEKPISPKYSTSKRIVEKLKIKKIKTEINLTFLSHPLFQKTKKIIDSKILGPVINYKIYWSFVSSDFNKKIKTWKTDEKSGGGIKNIFLTHILTYCEFFFKRPVLENYKIKIFKFKGLRYKKYISIKLNNPKKIKGDISIMTKKKGLQSHKVEINFKNGQVQLFTKSKDWTKNFVLKIYYNKSKKIKTYKDMQKSLFKDGRSNQIFKMIKSFIKGPNYKNLEYCLNAEKINHKLA
tara:strand:+ start:79 stop:1047 length:969 start_codon:yes stop_codon:yes gene_type:complete